MTLQRLTLLPQDVPARAPQDVDRVPYGLPEIMSIARFAQGGRWRTEAMRSYDRAVLIWITRGQGRLAIAGRSRGYGPHNAIFLPAGTMHGFSVAGQTLGHILWLPAEAAPKWPSEPVHLRLQDVQAQRELTGQLSTIETELNAEADMSDEAVDLHVRLLAIWFARLLSSGREPEARDESRAARLTEAFTALIERDFRRPVGIAYYAAALGVTPTHLSRVCRTVSGKPALDLLAERRHFEACRLLKDTRLPVTDIARQTGYRSAAYFTRAFRTRSGVTPTDFRAA